MNCQILQWFSIPPDFNITKLKKTVILTADHISCNTEMRFEMAFNSVFNLEMYDDHIIP